MPGIGDVRKSDVLRQRRFRRPLRHDRRRAGGDCGIDKTQAVGFAAGNGDENIAGFDRAAVRRHRADLEIGMASVEFRVRRQNLAKLHGS